MDVAPGMMPRNNTNGFLLNHAADVSQVVMGRERLCSMQGSRFSPQQSSLSPDSDRMFTCLYASQRLHPSNLPYPLTRQDFAAGNLCENPMGRAHGSTSPTIDESRSRDQRIPTFGSLPKDTSHCRSRVPLDQITIYNWYLFRPSDGERSQVAVGGFSIKGAVDDKRVETAPIVERLERCKLLTMDGMQVKLVGLIDDCTTLSNGFSLQIVHAFLSGFPYIWNLLVGNELLASISEGSGGQVSRSCGEAISQKSCGTCETEMNNEAPQQPLDREHKIPSLCHLTKNIGVSECDVNGLAAAPLGARALLDIEKDITDALETRTNMDDVIVPEEGVPLVSHVFDSEALHLSPTMLDTQMDAEKLRNTTRENVQDVVQCALQKIHAKDTGDGDQQRVDDISKEADASVALAISDFRCSSVEPTPADVEGEHRSCVDTGMCPSTSGCLNEVAQHRRSKRLSLKNMVKDLPELCDTSKVRGPMISKQKRQVKAKRRRNVDGTGTEVGADRPMDESEKKRTKGSANDKEVCASYKASRLPPPLPAPRVPVSQHVLTTAFGLKTSRSGRVLVPPLAHWRNQTLVHDMDGGIIAILNGSQDAMNHDTGYFTFKPPVEAGARKLQEELCAAATACLTMTKKNGRKRTQKYFSK